MIKLVALILALQLPLSAIADNKDGKLLTIGFGAGKAPFTMFDKQMIRAEGHEKHYGIEYSIVRQAMLLMHHNIKPKSIPPRELKKSIKKFRNIDAVSGVSRSFKDKLYYSRPILENTYVAVSRSSLGSKINSVSNLSSFRVSARTGSYATIRDGYAKLYHPKKGTHTNRYKEYDSNLNQHADFWKAGSEVVMITTKESFNHYRALLEGKYDTSVDIDVAEIFPTKIRLYVAFKDRKLKNEFNSALEDLKFEGVYSRIFTHYDPELSPDFRRPNDAEISRQLEQD
ncbi:transporter substrate-binding domain-containing protein [Candidatus Thioglobus sp.]|uniref:substrate-binding periplasmic protein n=1 Tax=Candidatus Thioglobus sp. TaxID=2026721 RepID=UPI002615CF5E|nr:transporter substrate-binding domain-containing protein [Candidatus Thioglobus sp.]MDG2395930.1 transporter substrate-binding domain-containing protein [Candidatus Thioglobus sp.]